MISVTTGGLKGGAITHHVKKKKKKKPSWKCPFGCPSSGRNAVKCCLFTINTPGLSAGCALTVYMWSPLSLVGPGPSNIRHCYWNRIVCFYIKWVALWVPGHTPERDCAEWRHSHLSLQEGRGVSTDPVLPLLSRTKKNQKKMWTLRICTWPNFTLSPD